MESLAKIRTTADDIILQVWNEVEEHYSELNDDDRRESASKYGIHYVFRKNEVQNFRSLLENENLNELRP
jgi:hypothetical protein